MRLIASKTVDEGPRLAILNRGPVTFGVRCTTRDSCDSQVVVVNINTPNRLQPNLVVLF